MDYTANNKSQVMGQCYYIVCPNLKWTCSLQCIMDMNLLYRYCLGRMMKPYLLFAILSFIVTLRSCQSNCEEQEPQESMQEERLNIDNFPRDFLKRYNDIDYDTFVGLMGRRSAGMNNLPPLKRDMDDIFVGLMGRRSSESSHLQSWRKEGYPQGRGAILFNKGKLRFRRGV
ncbi:tachykinin-3b isoform X2 [Conger conger]|uniref:tachykinin-3b isoform X2 n=1 Tax=Conger conger TaxID=82655 RepID=UPI002A5A3F8D|nr:tachykinin-3b isoform X2 [Conger conger]